MPATALAASGGTLYIGRAGGGLTLYDPARRTGATVTPPAGGGDTIAITAGGGRVWWLTAAPQALYTRREADGQVMAYPLRADSLRRIAWWHGRVALMGERGIRFLDPATGKLQDAPDLLPSEIAEATREARVWLSGSDQEAALAVAAPTRTARNGEGSAVAEVRTWRYSGGHWSDAGTLPVAAPPGDGDDSPGVRLALTPARLVAAAADGVTGLQLAGGETHTLPVEVHGDYPVRRPVQASLAGADAWWVRGSALFHADLERGTADAFLPWNDRGLRTRAVLADAGGAWVATDKGVRRLRLREPDAQNGYAGYVRLPLGDEHTHPVTADDQRLEALIEEWQGVPYLYGGAAKTGTDCSGFVMAVHRDLGIDLPHGSSALPTAAGGVTVHDELRYGDVLVYPGHCAIYIGDGRTAETVGGQVGYRSVWMRNDVVVRRFLNGVATSAAATRAGDDINRSNGLASRGGDPHRIRRKQKR